jgi:coenzyme F420-reducing hydrogenase beta subunit
LARFVIEEGGVVFGAAYDERMTVRHMAVDSWDSLNVLRGSKYVQSDVGETYLEVERLLQAGRAVLFSGTPCQIAGLKASNGKDYDRLVTCDLICHGVPSPKVFRLALGALQRRYDSEVEDFHFREKSFGWLYPTVYIKFRNDKSIYENNIDNHFNRGFLRNTYLRPSCYKCPAKLKGSVADITLGDFWQLLKYSPSMINRQGTSVVLVNTETGRQAIQRIAGHMTLTECPVAFVETDSNLCKSVDPPNDREAFFADLDLLPFEELVQKYIKPRSAVVRWLANIRRVTRCLVEGWSKA